jgi:hypothetical protein
VRNDRSKQLVSRTQKDAASYTGEIKARSSYQPRDFICSIDIAAAGTHHSRKVCWKSHIEKVPRLKRTDYIKLACPHGNCSSPVPFNNYKPNINIISQSSNIKMVAFRSVLIVTLLSLLQSTIAAPVAQIADGETDIVFEGEPLTLGPAAETTTLPAGTAPAVPATAPATEPAAAPADEEEEVGGLWSWLGLGP